MAADIHVFPEWRDLSIGPDFWQGFGEIHLPRSYDAFGRIAGVRRNTRPVVEPRGLPSNLSGTTEELYARDPYLHTPTWLTADEWIRAVLQAERDRQEWMAEEAYDPTLFAYRAVGALLVNLEAQDIETRIIVAFDS